MRVPAARRESMGARGGCAVVVADLCSKVGIRFGKQKGILLILGRIEQLTLPTLTLETRFSNLSELRGTYRRQYPFFGFKKSRLAPSLIGLELGKCPRVREGPLLSSLSA